MKIFKIIGLILVLSSVGQAFGAAAMPQTKQEPGFLSMLTTVSQREEVLGKELAAGGVVAGYKVYSSTVNQHELMTKGATSTYNLEQNSIALIQMQVVSSQYGSHFVAIVAYKHNEMTKIYFHDSGGTPEQNLGMFEKYNLKATIELMFGQNIIIEHRNDFKQADAVSCGFYSSYFLKYAWETYLSNHGSLDNLPVQAAGDRNPFLKFPAMFRIDLIKNAMIIVDPVDLTPRRLPVFCGGQIVRYVEDQPDESEYIYPCAILELVTLLHKCQDDEKIIVLDKKISAVGKLVDEQNITAGAYVRARRSRNYAESGKLEPIVLSIQKEINESLSCLFMELIAALPTDTP